MDIDLSFTIIRESIPAIVTGVVHFLDACKSVIGWVIHLPAEVIKVTASQP